MKDKAEIAAITVIVLGVGLIAGLVVNESRKGETRVQGTKFRQSTAPTVTEDPFVIPTIDSTIVPSVVPTPTPTATPTQTATARPTATTTATTVARPAGLATYDMAIVCADKTTYADGTAVAGGKEFRDRAIAGKRFTYQFDYSREQGGKRVTSHEQSCTIRTTRTRAGSEPGNLRVKLSCDGDGQYESTPPTPSTSVASRVWRPAQLLDGFTHRMTAPRSGQISERTRCLVEVVSV